MFGRIATIATLCVSLLLASVSTFSAQQVEHPDPTSHTVERFKISNDGDIILLPVKVDGRVYQFILDTGSGINIYDTSFRSYLGEPVNVITTIMPHAGTKIPLFTAPPAKIGNLNLQNGRPVGCVDLEFVRRVSGHDVRGVIGMAFLTEHVVELDFDQCRLSFLSSAPAHAGPAIPVFPLSNSGLPAVFAEVEGLESKLFVIHTGESGYGSGSLEIRDFDGLLGKHALKLLHGRTGSNAIATFETQRALAREARVQRYRVKNPVFYRGKTASLGLDYWTRFNVVFDFPNHLMYLKESRQFRRPDRIDLSGLHLLKVKEGLVAEGIDAGSAATAAGMQRGDVILKVDGAEANAIRLHVLRLRLCEEGKVVLSVRRLGRVFDAALILRQEPIIQNPSGENKAK